MPDPPTPDLRASDADRERAAELLRGAAADGQLTVEELDERLGAAYAARTRGELVPLTADLQPPEEPRGGRTAPEQRHGTFSVRRGEGGARWIVAVMSGSERRGRWRMAARCTAVNLMGGSEIDLSDVELADDRVELRVVSLMGGAEIHVPPGMNVRVSEFALMGTNRVDVPVAPPGAPGPVVHLRLLAVMGGNDVRRGPKRTRAERRALRQGRSREAGR